MKVGTGIGCGVIVDGRVYRGAQGSAGDIGHIYVAQPDGRTVVCRCGNENCLEAIAGGGALLRDALAAGLPVDDRRGRSSSSPRTATAPALELVRDAGRTIGTVLAALVNFFNPHRIVMTGGVAQAGAPLLAGIREAVYRRSMPLAARALEITVSEAPGPVRPGRRRARWRSRSSSTRTSVHQALAPVADGPDRPSWPGGSAQARPVSGRPAAPWSRFVVIARRMRFGNRGRRS